MINCKPAKILISLKVANSLTFYKDKADNSIIA